MYVYVDLSSEAMHVCSQRCRGTMFRSADSDGMCRKRAHTLQARSHMSVLVRSRYYIWRRSAVVGRIGLCLETGPGAKIQRPSNQIPAQATPLPAYQIQWSHHPALAATRGRLVLGPTMYQGAPQPGHVQVRTSMGRHIHTLRDSASISSMPPPSTSAQQHFPHSLPKTPIANRTTCRSHSCRFPTGLAPTNDQPLSNRTIIGLCVSFSGLASF